MYVYAFPVQQSIAALWHDVTPLAMLALALPVTYCLGLASWRAVERPALALKRRVA
jgi:peptidoglycan/LPS O-acetylase OafA/YrhL